MRIVCGLDVHKDSVFVCILNEKGEKFEAKYGALTPELEELHQLLLTHEVGGAPWKSPVFTSIPFGAFLAI